MHQENGVRKIVSSAGPPFGDSTLQRGEADSGESDEAYAWHPVMEETAVALRARPRAGGQLVSGHKPSAGGARPLLADAPDRRDAAADPGGGRRESGLLRRSPAVLGCERRPGRASLRTTTARCAFACVQSTTCRPRPELRTDGRRIRAPSPRGPAATDLQRNHEHPPGSGSGSRFTGGSAWTRKTSRSCSRTISSASSYRRRPERLDDRFVQTKRPDATSFFAHASSPHRDGAESRSVGSGGVGHAKTFLAGVASWRDGQLFPWSSKSDAGARGSGASEPRWRGRNRASHPGGPDADLAEPPPTSQTATVPGAST